MFSALPSGDTYRTGPQHLCQFLLGKASIRPRESQQHIRLHTWFFSLLMLLVFVFRSASRFWRKTQRDQAKHCAGGTPCSRCQRRIGGVPGRSVSCCWRRSAGRQICLEKRFMGTRHRVARSGEIGARSCSAEAGAECRSHAKENEPGKTRGAFLAPGSARPSTVPKCRISAEPSPAACNKR